ncbi:mitogen-activated protein kinase kinase kinase 1-like [Raphanus sativus]|uniref:mitogen-activated protein kinase kinase kinase n=1 Tax=Raphanus sativus TaxID=3726 RepID=A0A9W3BXS8_RAPSA|nr:mitogen-activated protein kinase kinase kinase 1-like [Raphanus sativus]
MKINISKALLYLLTSWLFLYRETSCYFRTPLLCFELDIHKFRVNKFRYSQLSKSYLVPNPSDVGGSLKRVRPPVHKPLSNDHQGSSWDFAPENEIVRRPSSSVSSNKGDEVEREIETEAKFLPGSIITSWQKGQLLGRGSFGSVYEGISGDGDFLAVKEVSLLEQGSQAQECIQQLEGEIALLSQLQHQNIVRYRGTANDGSNLYIFLELVSQGSLLKVYQRYKLTDSVVSMYTRQILEGLKYLHGEGFIHRDIKCANILVDACGAVKLADFGLAKVSKLNDIKSCKGTPFWMAPEVYFLFLIM